LGVSRVLSRLGPLVATLAAFLALDVSREFVGGQRGMRYSVMGPDFVIPAFIVVMTVVGIYAACSTRM
jgi:hypothetical protein